MELLRLAPQLPRLRLEANFGSSDHAQEELCFSGFLLAGADAFLKIFPRNTFVCLAVVCANAGSCANQLINESIISRTAMDFLPESNNCLAETSGPFLKIVRLCVVKVVMERGRFRIVTVGPKLRFPFG